MNLPQISALELKVVLRCRDFQASHRFYANILHLPVLETWEEEEGQGCIFGFGPEGRSGTLEISQVKEGARRYTAAFAVPFENDKIDLQLRTDNLDAWATALEGVWEFSGPKRLPWGERWIKLRDPDNLLVAIYESE
ncbi:MAG TPA: VOC family protein [Anaerolineales bacterium]|nr:VOC family protein [Anaerolineales bacterium]